MGQLRLSLLHLDISGLRLARFPPALMQLVALEGLNVCQNEFANLPAGITALSRLIELKLGRVTSDEDPLQLVETRALDVRALGNLSGFPVLRELAFDFCEVILSDSMPDTVRHSSITTICFCNAHPAPECVLTVLQMSQALRGLGRGRVVSTMWEFLLDKLENVQAPGQKFMNTLRAMEACGFFGIGSQDERLGCMRGCARLRIMHGRAILCRMCSVPLLLLSCKASKPMYTLTVQVDGLLLASKRVRLKLMPPTT